MKKRILSLVAILVFCMATTSHAWLKGLNPRTTEGQGGIKVSVYNDSGSDLNEGQVVVWNIGNSTGDNDLYVTTTTTANTGLVAGVVAEGGILTASEGDIIVYGLAQCDTAALGVAAGGLLCTSGTAGAGQGCAATDGSGAYAIAGVAGSSSQIACFVK